MASNYDFPPLPEEVHDTHFGDSEDTEQPSRTARCSTCRGTGLVEVYGQETDCIDCEGYGDVLV